MVYDIERFVPRDGIPVLKGFIKNGQLIVWCPFCRCFHIHCATDGTKSMRGHRVAHCAPDSPFTNTGYYIRPFTKGEMTKMRDC